MNMEDCQLSLYLALRYRGASLKIWGFPKCAAQGVNQVHAKPFLVYQDLGFSDKVRTTSKVSSRSVAHSRHEYVIFDRTSVWTLTETT
jgi:hypothetical protein